MTFVGILHYLTFRYRIAKLVNFIGKGLYSLSIVDDRSEEKPPKNLGGKKLGIGDGKLGGSL